VGRFGTQSRAPSEADGCQECASGKYGIVAGAASMAAGCTFSNATGATSSTTCTPCPPGTYQSEVRAARTAMCTHVHKPHDLSGRGPTACAERGDVAVFVSGLPVWHLPPGAEGCILHVPIVGSHTCISCACVCAQGTDPEDCTTCTAGRYSPTVGASSASVCQACPAGRYNHDDGRYRVRWWCSHQRA
jgi:hypothetical protein